jgi:hypothetical protein
LKNGVINDDITAILENEAASVVSQIKEGLIIK